ncbi:MAG: amidohydrolase family protein [Candidatus Atribacteria bacterium]|nr:amidohydrolase family protein [Candidatus Atribacteria bacterium]
MSERNLVLKGKIIDGTGREPITNGVIVIKDNKIEEIGPVTKIEIPKDAEVIELKEANTIIPGLIDAHLHLMGSTGLNSVFWTLEDNIIKAMRVTTGLKPLIEAGFTTVRDAGGLGVYLNRVIKEGLLKPAPRIFSANKVLSQTAGHGDVHSLPLDFVKNYGFGRICDGADECRKAAREQFREGADFIKICSTGGVLSERDKSEWSQFTIEEISAIVEEARRVDSYVASHAQGAEGINNALKAGVKTIEHGIYMDDEGIELMLEKNAVVIPTFSIVERLVTKGREFNVPEYGIIKSKIAHEAHLETIRKARKAGVKIALGTDFLNVPLIPFGENSLELEIFVNRIGFSPMEAIVAGTKISAEALQMSDKIGTLEKGKLADLIVVNGDPSKNISCLRNVSNILIVIKDGIIEKNIA